MRHLRHYLRRGTGATYTSPKPARVLRGVTFYVTCFRCVPQFLCDIYVTTTIGAIGRLLRRISKIIFLNPVIFKINCILPLRKSISIRPVGDRPSAQTEIGTPAARPPPRPGGNAARFPEGDAESLENDAEGRVNGRNVGGSPLPSETSLFELSKAGIIDEHNPTIRPNRDDKFFLHAITPCDILRRSLPELGRVCRPTCRDIYVTCFRPCDIYVAKGVPRESRAIFSDHTSS